MTLNSFQWSSDRTQPKWVGGKLELNDISMLSSKGDTTSQQLGHLNVNSISSSTPSLSYDICRSVDHVTMHYQVGSHFTLDLSD